MVPKRRASDREPFQYARRLKLGIKEGTESRRERTASFVGFDGTLILRTIAIWLALLRGHQHRRSGHLPARLGQIRS